MTIFLQYNFFTLKFNIQFFKLASAFFLHLEFFARKVFDFELSVCLNIKRAKKIEVIEITTNNMEKTSQ